MKILLAKTAGFCYGVSRAVSMVEQETEKKETFYTLGPIIHNPDVVQDLEKKNVHIIDDPSFVPEGSTVAVRSHGVKKEVMDILKEKNCRILDATCPFVKKIHNLVEKYDKLGYNILITGDRSHPEVEGILGWCRQKAAVISDPSDMETLSLSSDKLLVVSQTTFEKKLWEKIQKKILQIYPNSVIIDTICNATAQRQDETVRISKICDAMIVIGGKNSSNTKRLADVAKKNLEHVFIIENKSQLPEEIFRFSCVGVTAGASTPAYIIKEVIEMMEEKETNTINFEEELEKTLKPLNTGDIVKGTVIRMTPTEVFVGLDAKADGIIPADQVTLDPNAKVDEILKVGDEVEAFVVRVNDIEGYVTLSMTKLQAMAGQRKIEEAFENGEILKGTIAEVVNGGVIIYAFGTRVFVPASLAAERYTPDLETLVGKEVTFKIIRYDRRRRKVIGSVKEPALAEKKAKQEAFWSTAEVGQTIQGVVKSVTNFGAFVDIGGVDGLVHVSELSWSRIKHPSEVVKPGDVIEVTILDLNRENNKISLGYKKAADNPWTKAKEQFQLGDVVSCKIVRLLPFGAFAELIPGVDGLIYVSQISTKRIGVPADVLKIGDVVDAKIIDLNWETQKIGLSMRALMEEAAPQEPVAEEAPAEESAAAEEVSVEYSDEDAPVTIGDVAEVPTVEESEPAAEAPAEPVEEPAETVEEPAEAEEKTEE